MYKKDKKVKNLRSISPSRTPGQAVIPQILRG